SSLGARRLTLEIGRGRIYARPAIWLAAASHVPRGVEIFARKIRRSYPLALRIVVAGFHLRRIADAIMKTGQAPLNGGGCARSRRAFLSSRRSLAPHHRAFARRSRPRSHSF